MGTLAKILLAYFQVLNSFTQLPSVKWPAAFAAYLALPPSLAKVKHEQEAYAQAAPWVQTLQLRGYRLIQQLLPMSLMIEVLKHEGIPHDVIEACRVLVRAHGT